MLGIESPATASVLPKFSTSEVDGVLEVRDLR
jgi:hypothetical protein